MTSPPPAEVAPQPSESRRGPGYDPARLEYALLVRGLAWTDLTEEPFNVSPASMRQFKDPRWSPAQDRRGMEVFRRVVACLKNIPVRADIAELLVEPA
jgi:hypothetical protein